MMKIEMGLGTPGYPGLALGLPVQPVPVPDHTRVLGLLGYPDPARCTNLQRRLNLLLLQWQQACPAPLPHW